jgi:Planctomycete cytochrome C
MTMRIISFIALTTTPALAVDFVREVRPIFEKHCYECHGAEKQKNDYRLDIKAVALKNIKPGKSAESTLFRFVSGLEKDTPMPPKAGWRGCG